MTTRAWRQLLETAVNPCVPASQSVLRLALILLAADGRAPLTEAQRQWLTDRLRYTPDWRPFSAQELQRLRMPLLLYLQEYRPALVAMVEKGFDAYA